MKPPKNEDSKPSGAANLTKPKGLYFLWDYCFEQVYGPEEQAEIARRVDMAESRVTIDTYKNSDQTWPEVEVIFSSWGMTPIDEVFLSRFPSLKIVFYGAGSVRGFVTDAFWRSGARVTSAVFANGTPVVEYTCAQIIMGLKMVWQNVQFIRREGKYPTDRNVPGVYGTTVGLLSMGRIGREVAERLRSYEVKVVAFDPFLSQQEAERLNITLLPLDEVFARADVVSCHTPWLPETERMIQGRHFELLKPHATFINTARGAVIAEDEMVEVLQRRPEILVILDVTHPEPPVEGSPLYKLENVILTSHIAGAMANECRRLGRSMIEELDRYLAGEPLFYELDQKRAAVMA